MSSSPFAKVVAWVLVAVLAGVFLMAALGKLSGAAVEMFASWGYPAWFATLIGVLELVGAGGLLLPKTTRYAVLGLSAIMLGAAYTHLANNEGGQVLRPLMLLTILWVVLWLRRGPRPSPPSADVPQ
ncbi:MAG: DoxX family protein [Candidatus Krumholzibacteria bacterium]|nr:DoxX family protein [Candidatus Krumholzibacteria bacterium]